MKFLAYLNSLEASLLFVLVDNSCRQTGIYRSQTKITIHKLSIAVFIYPLHICGMKNTIILFIITLIPYLGNSQNNQNIEMAKIESGTFKVFKAIEKGYNKHVFEQAKKSWPVQTFTENGIYPKILIKRVGILEEYYNADLPNFPAYYFGGNGEVNVTVINKKIYYYTWSSKSGSKITYILSNTSPSSFIKEKETLDNYRRSIKTKQSGSREERKKENAAVAAKSASENSLKGKSIKSIKVRLVDPNADIGMFSVVAIGVEVTLTNGKVLKTKNLGGKTPYTDFESSSTGGNFTGGDFKVNNDTRQIPGDKIVLTVWSKFDKSKKGSLSQPLNYRNDVYYHYQGNGGSFGRGGVSGRSVHGGHGKDGRSVNITAVKMVINGQKVTKITVVDASTGKVLSEAKVHINNTVTINVKGGNGGNGAKGHFSGDAGGNGGDGGNGGTVVVSGSGTAQIKMIVQTQGGNAGAGGKGNESYNRSGSNGSRGTNGRSNK